MTTWTYQSPERVTALLFWKIWAPSEAKGAPEGKGSAYHNPSSTTGDSNHSDGQSRQLEGLVSTVQGQERDAHSASTGQYKDGFLPHLTYVQMFCYCQWYGIYALHLSPPSPEGLVRVRLPQIWNLRAVGVLRRM